MKKKVLLFTGTLLSSFMYSQIGVNTSNPKAPFHIDGIGNNTINPTVNEQLDDFVISNDGQIGIGTISPAPFSAVEIASRKPIRLPRLSEFQISDLRIIANDPQKNGLIIYNTDTQCINYWIEEGKKTLCP